MTTTLGELIVTAARRFGSKTALIFEDGQYTYDDLNERSSLLARHLQTLGIGHGDVVSLYAANCVEWVLSYYAILKIGGVVNPLNLMLTPAEVVYALKDCGARALMGSAQKVAGLAGPQSETLEIARIAWGPTVPDGAIAFADLQRGTVDRSAGCPLAKLSANDPCTISYTSGTTGQPKGALLTHEAILLNVEMTALMHERTSGDISVSALPCSHVYGNVVMQGVFLRGGTLVMHAEFDADRVLESIRQHRASIFDGVPTMYLYMLKALRSGSFDLSSLTRCTVGGQTMPVSQMAAVEEALGCRLIELWGMTEIGGLGATHALAGPRRLGSIGVALPHVQLRIADVSDPSRSLEDDQVGELQVRGPIVMREYVGNKAATADTILETGWLRTGDLARMDRDGYVYIVDRIKDMIITAGFNIYPAELERVIADHHQVAMVAVGSVPDPEKGELAKAYVVPKSAGVLDLDDLLRHCREHLAAYKVPRRFQLVSDLPRTSSGKVMRRALRQLDTD